MVSITPTSWRDAQNLIASGKNILEHELLLYGLLHYRATQMIMILKIMTVLADTEKKEWWLRIINNTPTHTHVCTRTKRKVSSCCHQPSETLGYLSTWGRVSTLQVGYTIPYDSGVGTWSPIWTSSISEATRSLFKQLGTVVWIKFLAQGNDNNIKVTTPGIKPGTFQVPGWCPN